MGQQPQDVLFVNGNAWATAQGVLEHWVKDEKEDPPAIFGVAETRLYGKDPRAAAAAWLRRRGYTVHHSGAVASGEDGTTVGPAGGIATSAGVLEAISSRWPSKRMGLSSENLKAGRAVLAKVYHPNFVGGIVVGSVYLHDGEGWSDRNIGLLTDLGIEVKAAEVPFLIMGDWNIDGADFEAGGWAQKLGAVVLRPRKTTCSAGKGSEIDFMVASVVLCNWAECLEVVTGAPVSPHWPIPLRLKELDDLSWITVRRKRQPLPTRRPMGCALPSKEVAWSWTAGRDTQLDLKSSWQEWVDNLEEAVLDQAEIPEEDRRPYRGRADGFVLEKKRVRHAWQELVREQSTPALRTWTAMLGEDARPCRGL
jgi:exonuclease III